MSPRLSVVVPTFNRRERLAKVLLAFERQLPSNAGFEVIVVDDGSSDGTSDWLQSHKTSFGLRHLQLTNGGPARARNAGVELASGEIVLFIDDDVEPMQELVAEHLRCHEAEKDVVVIGPLGSLPSYPQPWVAWEQKMVEAQYTAMQRGDWAPTFRQFWTGNASVPRAALLGVGGFDTTLKRAEDVELGLRLMQRGLQFRFNSQARGVHHAERSLTSWEAMHSAYGRSEVAIFTQVSEEFMLDTLSGNWSRLHPSLRWVIEQCVDHPMRLSTARALLRAKLKLTQGSPIPFVTSKACSVFANLLYWESSFEALGPARSARVKASAQRR